MIAIDITITCSTASDEEARAGVQAKQIRVTCLNETMLDPADTPE